jgi:hypothetical protein
MEDRRRLLADQGHVMPAGNQSGEQPLVIHRCSAFVRKIGAEHMNAQASSPCLVQVRGRARNAGQTLLETIAC